MWIAYINYHVLKSKQYPMFKAEFMRCKFGPNRRLEINIFKRIFAP